MRTLAIALFGLVPFGLFAAEASADPPPWSNARSNREFRYRESHRHGRGDRHHHRHHDTWRGRDDYRSYPAYRYDRHDRGSYRSYEPYGYDCAPYRGHARPGYGFGIDAPGFSFWLER